MTRRRCRTLLRILLVVTVSLVIVRHRVRLISRSYRETDVESNDDAPSPVMSCLNKTDGQPIRRAIVVHFPVARASVHLPELKWLYLSWIETIATQPAHWRTDLLIYSSASSIFDDLGCYPIERNSSANSCLWIDYDSIWTRSDTGRFQSIREHVPSWCRHLDSLAILLEHDAILFTYDYILRTDLDVFLTPRFARYVPRNCTIHIGRCRPTDVSNRRCSSLVF
jgi:hypothetical protein